MLHNSYGFGVGDVKDLTSLRQAMEGHEGVVHLASNPDIARAAVEPEIDFREGTLLTQNVVEAMRTSSAKRILYSSCSSVYGDLGDTEPNEDYGPLIPISTYGVGFPARFDNPPHSPKRELSCPE